MTCHVCANPTCVDDCQNYPPPALKVGSAEQKLQELLKIADDMAAEIVSYNAHNDPVCHFCFADIEKVNSRGAEVTHEKDCPILKLEQFKKTL